MKQQKCLIVLSYIENCDSDLIRVSASAADYIICADGGAGRAKEAGVEPDVVIGDFDSGKSERIFDCPYITLPTEKDLTDFEAAIIHAHENGYKEVMTIGGIGGRLDHTLGMMAVLLMASELGMTVSCFDRKNYITIVEKDMTIAASCDYKYFSLVPVYESASGVAVRGAKYELTDAVISRHNTLAISNEIIGKAATISVGSGPLFLVRSSD